MILDSSAVLSVVYREPGYERVLDKVAAAPESAIGAATLVEATIVASARLGRDARELVGGVLRECRVAVMPLTDAHAAAAIEAWWRFGKGRHKAALNFGDCLVYGLAKCAGRPILCCGDDFSRTDAVLS